MKTNLPLVIVVEGKTDSDFIRSFCDCEVVTTNGSAVPRGTIAYLQTLAKTKCIVVLCDPDYPGKKIRQVLDEHIDGLHHVYIEKKYCLKNGKVGIAEARKDVVLEALKHYVIHNDRNVKDEMMTISDLYDLGLIGQNDSSSKRMKIFEHFHLGYGNAKLLWKQLNSCQINKNAIEKVLYDGQ